MKCVMCKRGRTKKGTTSLTFQRDDTILIILNAPIEKCKVCGEEYVSEIVAAAIFRDAEEAVPGRINIREYVE
jgi:YgiT-type zinc finger domain-containing protein